MEEQEACQKCLPPWGCYTILSNFLLFLVVSDSLDIPQEQAQLQMQVPWWEPRSLSTPGEIHLCCLSPSSGRSEESLGSGVPRSDVRGSQEQWARGIVFLHEPKGWEHPVAQMNGQHAVGDTSEFRSEVWDDGSFPSLALPAGAVAEILCLLQWANLPEAAYDLNQEATSSGILTTGLNLVPGSSNAMTQLASLHGHLFFVTSKAMMLQAAEVGYVASKPLWSSQKTKMNKKPRTLGRSKAFSEGEGDHFLEISALSLSSLPPCWCEAPEGVMESWWPRQLHHGLSQWTSPNIDP